jgi:hypothetical protein
VTLALARNGSEKSVFHTSSVSIQASNRQTVYFDISDAKLDGDLGDVTLYLWVRNEGARSIAYDNADVIEENEQLLYVESITAHIKKGSGALAAFIIIIAVVLLLALAYFVFFSPRGNTKTPQRPPMQSPSGHPQMRNGAPVRPHPHGKGGRPIGQMPQRPVNPRPMNQGQFNPRQMNQRPPMAQNQKPPITGDNRWNQNMR